MSITTRGWGDTNITVSGWGSIGGAIRRAFKRMTLFITRVWRMDLER